MIVTPEGLNVFPEDVERALNARHGVRDSAVVGTTRATAGQERVHAVLVLDPGADADEIVRAANAQLEDHQRVRSFSVWPGESLPRTEGTSKLRRKEIQKWVSGVVSPAHAGAGGRAASAAEVVARFARHRTVTADTTIEELGLSSLERIELMMALEEALDTSLGEAEFAAAGTVGELERLVSREPLRDAEGAEGHRRAETQRGTAAGGRADSEIHFPRWNRSWPARALRRVSLPTWILPLARIFAWTRAEGLEHLQNIQEPVIFAANHQSHMDTPVIMWVLPARWRYRVAPAMAKEFFKAHFFPQQFTRKEYFTNSLNYYLSSLFFNAFPLPQREAGARQALRYAGELVGDGYSVLIFPEGRRTKEGDIAPFQPGVGMMASRLGVPVVPVRIDGLDKVLHPTWKMARPGRVRVVFGKPMQLSGDDYGALARQVEEAVRQL
jgi:long-chain acyl-CoA synthetase